MAEDQKNDTDNEGAAAGTGGTSGSSRSERLSDDVHALRDDLDALRADLTRLRDDSGDLAADAVATARERLEREAERLVQRLDDLTGTAEGEGRRILEEAEREVREHPLRTLAWAFGAGLVLGWLTRRG